MNILKLKIKKEWFDMVVSNQKKEEYRKLSVTNIRKLFHCRDFSREIDLETFLIKAETLPFNKDLLKPIYFRSYDYVHFFNGDLLSLEVPNVLVEFKGVDVDYGKKELGANPKLRCLIIKLGEIVNPNRNFLKENFLQQKCEDCLYSRKYERWNQLSYYCIRKEDKKSFNGLLRIKIKDNACHLFDKR